MQFRKSAVAVSTIIFVCFLSGCATILSETSEEVSVSSEPTNAQVYINGREHGETPLVVRLNAADDYTLKVVKSGFEPRIYELTKSVGAGWVVADVVLTGLLGVLVDGLTGAWYSFDTPNVNVSLERKEEMSVERILQAKILEGSR